MTRREEIEQAILENGIDYCENHPEMNMSLKVAFVMGAKWADKTMIEKATLDEVYKGLDQYENFLGLVACMRRAQKEANDMIAQVECYEEAMEHVKKAEELESMVDKWLEGEAL